MLSLRIIEIEFGLKMSVMKRKRPGTLHRERGGATERDVLETRRNKLPKEGCCDPNNKEWRRLKKRALFNKWLNRVSPTEKTIVWFWAFHPRVGMGHRRDETQRKKSQECTDNQEPLNKTFFSHGKPPYPTTTGSSCKFKALSEKAGAGGLVEGRPEEE